MAGAAWVALSLTEHLGGKTMRALLRHFDGDVDAILRADERELRRVPGVGPKIAAGIRAARPDAVDRDLSRWEAAGVRVRTWDDPDYPARLRALDDAPPTLFLRGAVNPDSARAVAVVGTRRPSPAGQRAAELWGLALARRGIVVVSGMALGIDRAAHLGALAEPAGRTLAVLGSGVLNLYPPANRPLAQAILTRGLLLSEVHPLADPSPATLVARNRLIAALADALIVVETEADGGAMHAARRARERGVPLYAVTSAASGNRALLADGAAPLAADAVEVPF